MNLISLIFEHFFAFIFTISVIVFVHELGHFLVARWCGVKVEQFSLGFGPKIFGFIDKKETEWKFCILPFGGYVKMYGDSNGASLPDFSLLKKMPANLRKISFLGKNVYQRFAIVAAGPLANFFFAILVLTAIFFANGKTKVEPIISEVLGESAAQEAGLMAGDKILAVNEKLISDFNEVRQIVVQSDSDELNFKILRDENELQIAVKPKVKEQQAAFGEKVKARMVGIAANQVSTQELNLWQSFVCANAETFRISTAILQGVGQLITGKKSIKELGGPVKIARYSKESMNKGIIVLAWFMSLISINLGVMNLIPLPVLDGGHLLFFIIEAIRGKPLSPKIQQIAFKIGLSLVLALMIFATFNDLLGLFIVN